MIYFVYIILGILGLFVYSILPAIATALTFIFVAGNYENWKIKKQQKANEVKWEKAWKKFMQQMEEERCIEKERERYPLLFSRDGKQIEMLCIKRKA